MVTLQPVYQMCIRDRDVSLYLVGDSESDKADLEKAAKAKNVEMHYIMQK